MRFIKPSAAPFSMFPIRPPSAQASVDVVHSASSTSKVVHLHEERESGTGSILPAAAAICLLNFRPFCRRDANSMLSRRPDPSSTTSSHRSSCIFSGRPDFLMSENLTSHFFLLAFSFTPTAWFSFSGPLPAFQHSSPIQLLLSCNPKTSHPALLFPSFPPSVIDSFKPFSSTSLFNFPKPFLPSPPTPCFSHSSTPPHFQRWIDVCHLTQCVLQYNVQEQSTPL